MWVLKSEVTICEAWYHHSIRTFRSWTNRTFGLVRDLERNLTNGKTINHCVDLRLIMKILKSLFRHTKDIVFKWAITLLDYKREQLIWEYDGS